jgi:hypothetical protein
MAAASGSRSSIVTASSSSLGQFRLAQSVDRAPLSNATKQTPLQISNRTMAQSSRPASGQAMQRPPPATAPSRSAPSDQNHVSSSPAGFGTLDTVELASNPLLEGVLRPNKDGRVKNPVPSKLKGKTDNKKGNFGVMHMGTTPGKKNDAGRDTAAERDAAARRTSENTALRAKAAQQEKYIPPRRRGLEAAVSDGQSAGNGSSPFPTSKEDQKQRARPLAPDETKFEQARLLTLLRSINPITVVDQICKAVAYFGGIPGAPPPEGGIFPESASTRETGALFIGWLAEIFPDLSVPEVHRMQDTPSGSQNRLSRGDHMAPMNEAPNPRNGFGFGQAISAPAWGLPHALPLSNPQGSSLPAEASKSSNTGLVQNDQSEQPRQSTPANQPPPEAPPPTTSTSKRGRGRPKGSRNKGKNDTQSSTEPAGSGNTDITSQNRSFVSEQAHDAPAVHGKGTQPDVHRVQTVGDQTSSTKQPQVARYKEPSWLHNAQKTQAEQASSILPATIDELSPEERAVLEALRQQDASEAKAAALSSVLVQGSVGAGLKRKRPPSKPQNVAAPLNPSSEQTQSTPSASSTLIPSKDGSMGTAEDALHWAPAGISIPTAPVAKRQRQRKPKAPCVNEPSSRNQTASIGSSTTPPVAPNVVPDSSATSSHQSVPASRPPAEGLEAHYEKFASRPQQLPQQNGVNHTSAGTSQQQVRQQQKPTSVASQSHQKQAPQMQQQISQQGSQRDDQKATQGTSARPSSTGFYNQRSHGSFSQQYPSSQKSQLYGAHQGSPQMSTSTNSNNSNNYRTANTHAIAQASPQFTQAENAYRIASPHTIPQPSPSFSQLDNNFRSTSAHSITQPSPAYTQAEKIYRAGNTQPIAQSSSTFSRTHNQNQPSHQSHYNHFTENPYADLPTIDTISHNSGSNHASVNLNSSGYAKTVSGGLSTPSRSASSTLFGTSPGVFDTGTNELLRGVSRPAGSNGVYGTSSGLGAGFEGTTDQELRERLLRNMGRR